MIGEFLFGVEENGVWNFEDIIVWRNFFFVSIGGVCWYGWRSVFVIGMGIGIVIFVIVLVVIFVSIDVIRGYCFRILKKRFVSIGIWLIFNFWGSVVYVGIGIGVN